jgi:hypothetical protein
LNFASKVLMVTSKAFLMATLLSITPTLQLEMKNVSLLLIFMFQDLSNDILEPQFESHLLVALLSPKFKILMGQQLQCAWDSFPYTLPQMQVLTHSLNTQFLLCSNFGHEPKARVMTWTLIVINWLYIMVGPNGEYFILNSLPIFLSLWMGMWENLTICWMW